MSEKNYTELKEELQNKYTNNLINMIGDVAEVFKSNIELSLGKQYIELSKEYNELEKYQDIVKKDFFSESNYLEIKNKVKELNEKLKDQSLSSENKEEITKNLKIYLDKLSTLNVTLNNKLKIARDRRSEIKSILQEMFNEHKDELQELKDKLKKDVAEYLVSTITNLKEELIELNKRFNITDNSDDFPLDFNTIKISQIPSKLESDLYDEFSNDKPKTKVEFTKISEDDLLNDIEDFDDNYDMIEFSDENKIKS